MIECRIPQRRAEEDVEERIHVYPLFGREHDLEHGLDCWCHPVADCLEERVIVHNVEH